MSKELPYSLPDPQPEAANRPESEAVSTNCQNKTMDYASDKDVHNNNTINNSSNNVVTTMVRTKHTCEKKTQATCMPKLRRQNENRPWL